MPTPPTETLVEKIKKSQDTQAELLKQIPGYYDDPANTKTPTGTIIIQPGSSTIPIVPPVTNSPGTGGTPAIPGTQPSPVPAAPQYGIGNLILDISNAISNFYNNSKYILAMWGVLPPGVYEFDGKRYKVGEGTKKQTYKEAKPPAQGQTPGATDPYAMNYDPAATVSDASEEYPFTGSPGPFDSRNSYSGSGYAGYNGNFYSPNVALYAYPNSTDIVGVPYYPYQQINAQVMWVGDGGIFGQNNAYYELDDGTTQQRRKGIIDDFLKAAQYKFFPPTHIFQERQNEPIGFVGNSNMIEDYLNGSLPDNITYAIPSFNFGANAAPYRKLELRVNSPYGGTNFYVINPNNGTWRPAEPTNWYTALTGQLAINLRGCNQQDKVSTNPYIKQIFAFSDSSPMTGYNIHLDGVLLTNSREITATYDDSGTNKITIFDLNCISRHNPVCFRTRVNTLSSYPGIPPIASFIFNNNIDQGKHNTFIIMQHNAIKSLNIPRPFYIEYCNAYFPAFSGRIHIR